MHWQGLLVFFLWHRVQHMAAQFLRYLPPPLLVTCSNSQHQVYQRKDNALQVSCFWDRSIKLTYSKALNSEIKREQTGVEPPPHCRWYRDSVLVTSSNHWSGQLAMGTEGPHPPWAFTQITMHCISALCQLPKCLHRNLSIEVSGQDVRLFLVWPRTLPIYEWQPVRLGWCARLKSSPWTYRFISQEGSPTEHLIPSNEYNDPPKSMDYPSRELHRVCNSYYNYHVIVRYPNRGLYTALLHTENGPQLNHSLELYVQPALLHVFSASSQVLSVPHTTLSLSWTLRALSSRIMAYTLVDVHGTVEWNQSYTYNPFAVQNDFCASPRPRNSREKVMASVYFRTVERIFEDLRGKLDFSNYTLNFTVSNTNQTYIILNPKEIRRGVYVFSPKLGLFYSTQEGGGGSTENSSSHYIFYQQESLSYLIVIEFVQLQWYRFIVHIYLNRQGTLFRFLGEKDIDVHVFNGHSPDKSLGYIVWFIPLQHPLLQCEWEFNLQLFDSKEESLLQNNTYTYRDRTRNAAHLLPRSLLPFQPARYTGFVAEVNCRSTGLARAVLKATVNTYASKVMEPTMACQKSYCHELKAIIHKTSVGLVIYTRSTVISLQATVKAACKTHTVIDIAWNIYEFGSFGNIDWSKPVTLPAEIRSKGVTFHVPGNLLMYGWYVVNVTMTVDLPAYKIRLRESDALFIEIKPSELVAVIAGGYFRTVGFSDQWSLDGSASFDPDNATERLQFMWFCSKQESDYVNMVLSTNAKCYLAQGAIQLTNASDLVLDVKPETLQENTRYYYRLEIRNTGRSATAMQIIHVLPGSLPVLDFTCIENCDKYITPSERLTLSGKCTNCEARQPSYLWSLLSATSSEIKFDWVSKTTTGRTRPYISIKPSVFGPGSDKFYTLSLKVSTRGKQSSVYKYSFYVKIPPRTGKCIVYPRVGMAFLTKFVVQCSGFEDTNGPLTYKATAYSDPIKMTKISSVENVTSGTIVYIGPHRKTPPTFLPLGIPSKKYVLVIQVEVEDVLGASSQVTLNATVHDPQKSKPTGVVLSELHGLVNGSSAPMTMFVVTKDYFNIAHYVYMVAAVLNKIEPSPRILSSKTELRQNLLNVSSEIPVTDINLLHQVVLIISLATQEANEINWESQNIAARKLKEASQALKLHRDKGLGSTETEKLASAIFTGLSNVLRASLLNTANVNLNVIKEVISMTEILADIILQGKIPGEPETHVEDDDWAIHLRKNEKWDVSESFSKRKSCKNCFYLKLNEAVLPVDAVISTVLYEFDENPFLWLPETEDIRTTVAGFKMAEVKANGDIIGVTPEKAEVIMARKDMDFATFRLTIGPDKKLRKTIGGFNFEVMRNPKDIFIQILSTMKVTFNVSVYLGLSVSEPPIASYIAFFDKPPVSRQHGGANITDCAFMAPYILCLPWSWLQSSVEGSRANKWNISVVLRSHPIARDQTTNIVRIALFSADCLVLNGVQDQWREGTCTLGPQTSWSKIHCICNAKARSRRMASPSLTDLKESIIFQAGKLYLYANPVDMNKVLLAEFDKNPVTLLTILFIFALYVFFTVWAMIKDKVERKRKGQIVVLPDNDPFHRVYYLVTVYTGSRLGSGTTADVFIELIGENGISDVHNLKSPKFPIFFRGAVDTFLLTTKNDLGNILSLHVWHNNGGSSPNWYLSRIKVHNVKTKQYWIFLCRKWFGLGKADCKIERSFLASHPGAPLKKMDYFLIKLANDLEDSHIWLSIFTRVVTGSFNRVQRLSCCLVIMLSTLLFNIMFFSGEKEQIISVKLRYLRTFYIGFVSAAVCIPLQLIITILFTYSMEKPSVLKKGEKEPKGSLSCLPENLDKLATSSDPQKSKMKAQHLSLPQTNDVVHQDTDTEVKKKPPARHIVFFPKRLKFAWWWRYVAWALVFFISGISSFFIILYGLSYGYATSMEWFIASMTSFGQSVFLLQTLKMVLLSAMSTINLKYSQHIPWISTDKYQKMKLDKVTMNAVEMRQKHRELVRIRRTREYKPLEEDAVIILRKRERAAHLAFVFVKDIVCHLIFSSCILSIMNPTETTTSFYYNRDIYNKFSVGLSKVNRLEHIYLWTRNVFVPLIHNHYQPTYLSETWSKILGLPRMRQIRAMNTEKLCFHPHSFVNNFVISQCPCLHEYGKDPEDESDYLGSWTVPTNKSASNHSSIYQGFTYQSDIDQWEYRSYGVLDSYGPGGYSFYFFPGEQRFNTTVRLDNLQRNRWLDDRTWAVIFELTTFNPDVDLYCSITLVFETSELGTINTSLSVHSYKLSLFRLQTNSQIFAYGLAVYILVFYLADEFHMLRQERIAYLKIATNLINFAIKTICLFFILLVSLKFKLAFTLLEFYLLNPEEFVPFHVVSQIDQLFRIISGFLAFLLVLKPYRYFRFIYKMRLAEKCLSQSFPGMVSMSILSTILFLTYTSFGYLIFGQHEWNYNSMIHSAQTVISYCFSPRKDIRYATDRWVEILFRASLLFTVMFIFINLWRSVFISVYESVKQPTYEQHSDEAEAIYFAVLKIQSLWPSFLRRTPSTSEHDLINKVIFGKPKRGDDQQLGLKHKDIDGKKLVYLSI